MEPVINLSKGQPACLFSSPIGKIVILGRAGCLERICLNAVSELLPGLSGDLNDMATVAALSRAQQQIAEYFSQQRRVFELPLSFAGQTPFSVAVLTSLAAVPLGATLSYGALAALAGSPSAARAVGGVMARNPFPLVIPCHRVIGKSGQLTGFSARGGLPLKQQLLQFEADFF